MTSNTTIERPACACHQEPMLKHGHKNGKQLWRCATPISEDMAERRTTAIYRARQQVNRHSFRANELGVENTLTWADWKAILDAQDWKCRCGAPYTEMHHRHSIANGHTAQNVVPVCHDCHRAADQGLRTLTRIMKTIESGQYRSAA